MGAVEGGAVRCWEMRGVGWGGVQLMARGAAATLTISGGSQSPQGGRRGVRGSGMVGLRCPGGDPGFSGSPDPAGEMLQRFVVGVTGSRLPLAAPLATGLQRPGVLSRRLGHGAVIWASCAPVAKWPVPAAAPLSVEGNAGPASAPDPGAGPYPHREPAAPLHAICQGRAGSCPAPTLPAGRVCPQRPARQG